VRRAHPDVHVYEVSGSGAFELIFWSQVSAAREVTDAVVKALHRCAPMWMDGWIDRWNYRGSEDKQIGTQAPGQGKHTKMHT
jgi:hypothetical protein